MKKKLIVILLVTFNLLIYFTVIRTIFTGKDKSVRNKVSTIENKKTIQQDQTQLVQINFDYSKIKSNPFKNNMIKKTPLIIKDVIQKAPEVIEPDFILRGIMFDENSPKIITEDMFSGESSILNKNDVYKNSKIIEISKDHVIIEKKKQKFKLTAGRYEKIN